ncbi:MAG: hypothetical protein RL538_223 [Candidatus Parcubacteria bacterium]|jgi:zinc protease
MKYNIIETTDTSFATISDPGLETVIAYFSVDIHDGKTVTKRAVEFLYADMLMSGAGKYNRAEFLDTLNGLGANITVGISDGVCTLSIRARKDVAKKVFALTETILLSPHFDGDELKRVKQTVTNAIIENKENARALAHQQLRNSLYGAEDRRFTFKEDALIEAIKKVTPKDLKTLHKRIMGQFFTCSVAAEQGVAEELKKTLRKIRKNYPLEEALFGIHQQLPPVPRLITKEMPSKQNIEFSIGTPVPITLHHPDFIPLIFGLLVLGGPLFASRLMSTVREKEGLTYGISADGQTFLNEEQGYIRIGTFFSPDNTIKGLSSTFREIKALNEKGISQAELEQFKVIFETKQTLIGDSISRQLSDLHSYHMQKFSLEEIALHKAKIKKLTAEEVNSAMKLYLDPATLIISAVGPIKAIKKDLEAFMKTVA